MSCSKLASYRHACDGTDVSSQDSAIFVMSGSACVNVRTCALHARCQSGNFQPPTLVRGVWSWDLVCFHALRAYIQFRNHAAETRSLNRVHFFSELYMTVVKPPFPVASGGPDNQVPTWCQC